MWAPNEEWASEEWASEEWAGEGLEIDDLEPTHDPCAAASPVAAPGP